MKIDVIFNENRKIEMSSTTIGVVGEKNATVLVLNCTEGVPEGKKTLVFNNRKGSFRCEVNDDNFKIPKKVTTEQNLTMSLEIEGDDYVWYSEVIKLKLQEGTDASGKNKLEWVEEEKPPEEDSSKPSGSITEEAVLFWFEGVIDTLHSFYKKYFKKEETT